MSDARGKQIKTRVSQKKPMAHVLKARVRGFENLLLTDLTKGLCVDILGEPLILFF